MTQEHYQCRISHLEAWALGKAKETTSKTDADGSQKAKLRQGAQPNFSINFEKKIRFMTAE